jgi:hypothetical protein
LEKQLKKIKRESARSRLSGGGGGGGGKTFILFSALEPLARSFSLSPLLWDKFINKFICAKVRR